MTASLEIRLTPRGGRDAIDGPGDDGVWRVRVAAPPVDGAANRSLVRLLVAEALDVPLSAVRIESGEGSRRKRLAVEELSEAYVVARLTAVAGDRTGRVEEPRR